ncbi:MAG: hypothetical protein Q4A58_02500 [Fusobacterium sp.]|uniref:hypothetical protein n=1 Tax=Fusobacterium sp. TaxID=68766 RepID=UPI0026DB1C04|nr:hypothetical protein [Fusobacterium sp.]MDO4690148.1 hypothetical protein [Fusobacterium sp.]
MKREVMKKAWMLMRKGYNKNFATCLKAAWALEKRVRKVFSETSLDRDELNNMMKFNKAFKHSANKSNISRNVIYQGQGIENYRDFRLWAVEGRARVYVERYIDNIFIEKMYTEIKTI